MGIGLDLTIGEWIRHLSALVGYTAFLWVPVVFLAYSVGRRRIGIRSILIFIAIEAAAVALNIYLYLHMRD